MIPHARPILIIALTNRALDHLLSGVLDAGITTKIARLGSRSADERIAQYTVTNLDKLWSKYVYHELKSVRAQLVSLVESFSERQITSRDIMAYIKIQYPDHHEHICNPPEWISTLILLCGDSDESGGQEMARKRGSKMSPDDTTYGRWLRGEDLDFLSTRPDLPVVKPAAGGSSNVASEISNRLSALSTDAPVDNVSSDNSDSGLDDEEGDKEYMVDSNSEREADWQRLGISEVEVQGPLPAHSMNSIPEIPVTDRELETLLAQASMWTLSKSERLKLDQYWREQIREGIWQGKLEAFENLRRNYTELLKLGVSCVSI